MMWIIHDAPIVCSVLPIYDGFPFSLFFIIITVIIIISLEIKKYRNKEKGD